MRTRAVVAMAKSQRFASPSLETRGCWRALVPISQRLQCLVASVTYQTATRTLSSWFVVESARFRTSWRRLRTRAAPEMPRER
ncbi:hypothetical protein PybrP1_011364 [[Pythium] brassicae (nom. inval.)]|nr:hypothetical protein PybrP1_011364 [[Pythium] brassicae (nom. inval.)]